MSTIKINKGDGFKKQDKKSHCAAQETQENLTTARQEFLDSTNNSEQKLATARVDKIEKDLDAQLAELLRAKDALRKTTEARKKNCYNWKPEASQPTAIVMTRRVKL